MPQGIEEEGLGSRCLALKAKGLGFSVWGAVKVSHSGTKTTTATRTYSSTL